MFSAWSIWKWSWNQKHSLNAPNSVSWLQNTKQKNHLFENEAVLECKYCFSVNDFICFYFLFFLYAERQNMIRKLKDCGEYMYSLKSFDFMIIFWCSACIHLNFLILWLEMALKCVKVIKKSLTHKQD